MKKNFILSEKFVEILNLIKKKRLIYELLFKLKLFYLFLKNYSSYFILKCSSFPQKN
jgi:hypothetical protein